MTQPPNVVAFNETAAIKPNQTGDRNGFDNIQWCNSIFSSAYLRGASDIHIEPFERAFRVRFRIDGVLVQSGAGTSEDYPHVVSRFKVIAGLDITQRHRINDRSSS